MKFRVKVQYPWAVYFEKEVEVEAVDADQASDLAMEIARTTDGFWDDSCQVGDGDAGDTEVWEVNSVRE